MADISDVATYLAQVAASAVYPNGNSSPSIAGIDCRIQEGWPVPDQLDLDVSGKMLSGAVPVARPRGVVANISVYPMQGTGVAVYQLLDNTYVISPPVYGLTVTINGNTITVQGQPTVGEYLTLFCDQSFVFSQTNANTAGLLAALAAQATAIYPSGVIATATTLVIPATRGIVVRQGATAIMGKVTHRQRQQIMVTVWAPSHSARSTLAAAIDNVLKQSLKINMPDTSQALLIYNRTNQSDEQQSATIYRRDLIYDVEYATVQQFTGYVVTSSNISKASFDTPAVIPALTSGVSQAIPSLAGLPSFDFSQQSNSENIPLT